MYDNGEVITMDMTEYIRIILVKRGNMTETELARRINTSPQNIHNKFKRNNFTMKDLQEISNALDCDLDIRFIDHSTGNAF